MFRIYLLHGFLGRAEDWARFESRWPRPWEAVPVDLYSGLQPLDSLGAWAKRFCQHVRKTGGSSILIGYSMGGRLAMHALREAPELFDRAVIVSSHPGLTDDAERRARLESDRDWARRFETDDWGSVIRDWNAQGVLAASASLEPPEPELDRWKLADCLRWFSLGEQDDLRPFLENVEVPLLWLAGEKDSKYAALARELEPRLGKQAPAQVRIVPGAGHRVPWDAPEKVFQIIQEFL